MSSNAPFTSDVNLSAVLSYISSQFGMLGAQILDISDRQDILRDRTGALNEQHREATQGLRDRIEELEKLVPTVETTNKVLSELRPMIESQMQHAGRVAEGVRSDFAIVSARYQQSIGEIQVDFEEKNIALQDRVTKQIDEAVIGFLNQIAAVTTRIEKIESTLANHRKEDASITTARIGRSERVMIAAFGIITSVVTALLTYLATRPSP